MEAKLLVVFDLDETLVHCFYNSPPDALQKHMEVGETYEAYDGCWFAVRPGVWYLFRRLKGLVKFGLCSLASGQYFDRAVELLDPEGRIFEGRVRGRFQFKDDRKAVPPEWMQVSESLIIVDDNPWVWPKGSPVRVIQPFSGLSCKEDARQHRSVMIDLCDEITNKLSVVGPSAPKRLRVA